MKSNINKDELKLLAYCHEHAEGYGPQFMINTGEAMKALGLVQKDFLKHWSYLSEHGLVGSDYKAISRAGKEALA